MGILIKVSLLMGLEKVLEFIRWQMGRDMKEIERKENNMEKELILIALEWN